MKILNIYMKILICSVLTFSSALCAADIRYITDIAYIPLRSGAGADYRILHYGLKSGLKLNVLEMPKGDWAKVQTPTGREGWIQKQYLVNRPIARDQLKKAQTDLLETSQALKNLKQEYRRLKEAHTALDTSAKSSDYEKSNLEKKYHELKKISENAVNLDRQNKKLLASNDLLETELDSKIAIVDSLTREKTVEKWLVGAGLITSGMILMALLPTLRPKKRYSDWA